MPSFIQAHRTPSGRPIAGRIKSLIQSVSGRGSSIVAIDLDGVDLHLAEASRCLGRTTVTRLAMERLEGLEGNVTAKTIGLAIAQRLRPWGLSSSRVVMGIPRTSVILRSLTLPHANSLTEMASMVHYQISKDLPFRLEEAVVDFKVQRSVQPSTSMSAGNQTVLDSKASPAAPQVSVLVAVIKKEVLKYHQELAQAAGFHLSALGLGSYANARCVKECLADGADQCVALATLKSDEVVVDILLGHELLFSRVASLHSPPPGSEGLTSEANPPSDRERSSPPEAASISKLPLQEVAMEIVRSFHCYEGLDNHCPVTRLYLAGPQGQLHSLDHLLHEHLNLPVTALDPIQALNLVPSEKHAGTGAFAVLGLAYGMLDEEGLPFDFLHPKRPLPPGSGRHTRILAITAAISVLLCLLLGLRTHLIRKRAQAKAALQQQLNAATQNLSLYRQTIAQARTIKTWLADEKQWLDHLTYLCAILPPSPELYVISLSTGSKGSIHLTVKARNSEVITRLDTRLREAGYEMKPPAITPSGDLYDYPFQASLEITASQKLKIDLEKLQFTLRPEDDGSLNPASSDKPGKATRRARPSSDDGKKGGAS